MNTKQFDKLANEAFGSVLLSQGFSNDRSKHCTFYREISTGFYHIVLPDLGTRGVWYDVKVFAYSEFFDATFSDRFPDELGIPTETFCYLAPTGIGPDQTQFNCKNEESFKHRFDLTVAPLIASIALPYLDKFVSLSDLLPKIRSPLYRAIATFHVVGGASARSLLEPQKRRLLEFNSNDEQVVAMLRLIESLLART
jgi:hypothetical protein